MTVFTGRASSKRSFGTKVTESLAGRMAARARAAGIEIALVDARGNVFDEMSDHKRLAVTRKPTIGMDARWVEIAELKDDFAL